MATRVWARRLVGLRSLQNALRTMCTAPPPPPPPETIDPHYLSKDEIDIEELFTRRPVRELLEELRGFDLERIFAKKKQETRPPSYELLTDLQLKKAYDGALKRASKKLQMPPIMRKRVPCERILRKDPEIQGFEEAKLIFTDISFGVSDRFRPIVVREPNGVLRTATWEERDRLLQTYLTRPEREIVAPAMFSEPHLTEVLDKGWYIFVLERACAQFEPDDGNFIRVCHRAFDHINENSAFDVLHSTRYCGPMCFYFAVTKNGDNFVLHLLKSDRLKAAAAYVKLLHMIYPDSRSAENSEKLSSDLSFVEAYVNLEAKSKAQLDLALRSYHDVSQAATA